MKVKDLIKKLELINQDIELIQISEDYQQNATIPVVNRVIDFKKIDDNFYQIYFKRCEYGTYYPKTNYDDYFKYVSMTEEDIDKRIKELEASDD